MVFSCRDLDETTIDAAEQVVAERFCPEASAMVRRLLSNPLRAPGDDIGSVVYEGERVMGVTGSIARRLYLGKEPFTGINGGFLAMRRDAPPALLFALLRHAHRPRFGSALFYSNTCSPATAAMKPCVGVKNHGPESWSAVHVARLRRYPSLRRRVKRSLGISLPERLALFPKAVSPLSCAASGTVFARDRGRGIEVRATTNFSWADDFFGRYLGGNDGVVGSRSTPELEWLFGDAVSSGRSIALAAQGPDGVDGYVVASPCHYDPSRWLVVDAIAVGNDQAVLSLLLSAAKRAVRACSDAERLEAIGFPAWLQKTVSRHFRKSRPTVCNGFMWGFSDAEFARRCGDKALGERGWFFGPYDGDFCICPQ